MTRDEIQAKIDDGMREACKGFVGDHWDNAQTIIDTLQAALRAGAILDPNIHRDGRMPVFDMDGERSVSLTKDGAFGATVSLDGRIEGTWWSRYPMNYIIMETNLDQLS